MDKNADKWNAVSVVLLLVGVEHGLIALKLMIAQAIPDVPQDVIDSEAQREKVGPVVDFNIRKLKN